MKRIVLAAAAFLALAPAAAFAQQTPAANEEAAVAAAVRRLFDGMRAADSAMVRAAFHPEATLRTVAVRQGQTMTRTDQLQGFVTAVGTPHDQVWDERISDLQIRIDGPLATAWMNYTFYAGATKSHCGVNSFELVKMADGWKITHIADTRRREGCPDLPPGGGR